MFSRLRRPGIFPRREFQRRVVQYLRATPEPPAALSQVQLERLAADSGVADAWSRHRDEITAAVAELISQRIVLCPEEWAVGKPCLVNSEAIVGESAEERLARLPQLAEVPAAMAACGNLFLGFGALLFFIFYSTYLPQSWIAPVTGTATFIGALLGYAGLKLADTRAVSASQWTVRKWGVVVGVTLFLGAVNLVGYRNPCTVDAPPGAVISVDGKAVLTVPPIDSDEAAARMAPEPAPPPSSPLGYP